MSVSGESIPLKHRQFTFRQNPSTLRRNPYQTLHMAAGKTHPMVVRDDTQCFMSGETSKEKTVLTIHTRRDRLLWRIFRPGEICFPSATETSGIITRVEGNEIKIEPFDSEGVYPEEIGELIDDAYYGSELLPEASSEEKNFFKNGALGVSLPYNLDDLKKARILNHVAFLVGKSIEPDTMPRFAAQLIFEA